MPPAEGEAVPVTADLPSTNPTDPPEADGARREDLDGARWHAAVHEAGHAAVILALAAAARPPGCPVRPDLNRVSTWTTTRRDLGAGRRRRATEAVLLLAAARTRERVLGSVHLV